MECGGSNAEADSGAGCCTSQRAATMLTKKVSGQARNGPAASNTSFLIMGASNAPSQDFLPLSLWTIAAWRASTEVTSSKSRSEFGGPKLGKVKRLRDIETQNQRLPKAIRDITLDQLVLARAALTH